ncbi:retrotransposon protein, putative, ty1-copia subclass [Tanacetum coccineum]
MSESDKGLKLIQEEDIQPSENTSEAHNEVAPIEVEPQNIRVPIRRSTRIPQVPNRYGYYVDIGVYELGDLDEPPNYKAALADPESDKWLEAMNKEMQSMKDNQVWYLFDLPSNGYIRAIRILLAITTFYDYEIWQIDVKTAFLNGHLSDYVYMVQPEGFMDPKHPNKVFKLQRSIYGLKQASRNWNKRFDEEIKKFDFSQNLDEPCVYLKANGSNVLFLDSGEAAYILRIKSICDRFKRLISLSQSAYLKKILKKFRMENYKKGYTSMMEKPDCRNRFQQNPGEIHWTAVKTILKYLGNTKDMVLVYGEKPEDELKVSCYADASFQTVKDNTKSQTGYVFILNGGVVDWKSSKQSTTTMSSTEAEYIAAVEASMEAVWMRKFIEGLGDVMPSNKRPMEMLCDNEPALAIASDPGILKGARQFQRKYHYICEVTQEGEIILKKVHTDDNVAGPFTKLMSFNKHFEHAMAIGIVHASSLM